VCRPIANNHSASAKQNFLEMDNNSLEPSALPTPKWLHFARAFLLVATAGAGYLAWVSLHHGAAAGCGVESGCNAVLLSRWAYWLNVPVSLPALGAYLGLLGCTVLLRKRTAPDDERGTWAAMIVLSVLIIGSAFWFVSLQVFVIQSFCKYCLTAHACGFAAALLCLMNVPYATEPDTPMWATGSGKRGVPRSAMALLIGTGMAGVIVLAAGQVLVQKEMNVVKVVNKNSQALARTNVALNASSAPDEMPLPNAHFIAPRTLSLYSNQFVIKFDELPVMGSPDAPHAVVCMLDYTCSHCRALHEILARFSGRSSNQLAIICLPVSLSAKCNPFIPHYDSHANPDACEYARLSLAVWHAKPQAFREFDSWLFDGPKPPPVADATARANQILGDQSTRALNDPWVTEQLITDCKIHRANWLSVDSSAMPQIVMGNAVSSGPINSEEHLRILLNRYMGLTFGSPNR
jgi:uncharacterized membrane protein